MEKLINLLNSIVLNDNYIEDEKTIKEIINILNIFLEDKNNITNDLLKDVDDKIKYLDRKYDDLYDLVNMYDPIKIEFEKYLHKCYVVNLRNSNRMKKEGRKI